MKNSSEQIQNLITITQHTNEKYKNGLSAKYVKMLTALLRGVRNIIRVNYDKDNTALKAKSELQKLISTKMGTGLEKIKKSLNKELEDFMKVNNKLYTSELNEVFKPVKDFLQIKEVDDETIVKNYNKNQMTFDKSGAHTVESLWLGFSTRLNSIVKQTVNQAYVLEEEPSDFESEIYGITANTNVSKGNLDAVIASLVAHGFSTVLRTVNKSNTGIYSGYLWESVIDSATSAICQDLHMKYYLFDAPEKSTLPYEIYVPAHFNCRSANPPITKTYEELGIPYESLTEEQRQLLGEPDLRQFSYKEFFESQPVAVQKEILGAVRYDLYRKGEITIDKFFTRDGRKYTLAELERKGYQISEEYMHFIRK